MALAPDHEVVAVDVNPAQLQYAECRIAGEPPLPGTVERLMGMGRAFAPLVGWWRGRVRCFPVLRGRMERCFARHANATNPCLRALRENDGGRYRD